MLLKERVKGIIIGLLIGVIVSGTLTFAKRGSEQIDALYSNIKIYVEGTRITPRDANGNIIFYDTDAKCLRVIC